MVTCPFCSKEINVTMKPVSYGVLGICRACMNAVVLRRAESGWEAAPPKSIQDIRQVASDESIGGFLIKALPEAIESLPVLPEIAHRILRLLRDPEAALKELGALINEDQVIALRVLKLANSAMYGGLTEIKDLKAACARLGIRTVSNAVQAVANGRLYQTSNPELRESMENLWRHAVATAHCAGEIATMMAEPCTDIYFVAGLVHDVGKVLLLDVMSNRPSSVMQAFRDSPELFQEVLRQYHSLVGLHIIHHWKLPPEFAVTTFCHEEPDAVPDDYWRAMVHAVALASAVANASGFGEAAAPPSIVSLPSTKYLGLNDLKIATLRIDLEDQVTPLLKLIGDKN